MADIFISYEKADRFLVERLSAHLETEGWTTWWDRNSAAGETYRDVIMAELANARAVVVLWTESSITSDWVRAEAGRARADGKLIPLKTADTKYCDIPLPFGEMHTEFVENLAVIRSAIVALLAKPRATPTSAKLVIANIRHATLTWIGIVGGAVNLFTNLRGLLDLASWARLLANYWREWIYAIWHRLFELLGIDLPEAWSVLLTFLAFAISTALGPRINPFAAQSRDGIGREVTSSLPPEKFIAATITAWILLLAPIASIFSVPALVYFCRARLWAGLAIALYLISLFLLGIAPRNAVLERKIELSGSDYLAVWAFAAIALPAIPVSLALQSARLFEPSLASYPLWSCWRVALSELSKLNLRQYFDA